MRYEIAQADTPNVNGRVYPLKTVQEIADQIQRGDPAIFVIWGDPREQQIGVVPIEHVAAIAADPLIDEDGRLTVGVKILETPCGQLFKGLLLMNAAINITTSGTGYLREGVVEDFKLTCLILDNA